MAQKPLDFDNPRTLTNTPKGIEIAYFVEPRRAYAVRSVNDAEADTGKGGWREVPSVTTILGCLDKPALPWWGMGVGVDGVMQLIQMGVAKIATDGKLACIKIGKDENDKIVVGNTWVHADKDSLILWLTRQKLTVNHVLEEASDRGMNVHDAFEAWAATGKMPDPHETHADGRPVYAPEELGYVEALRKFVVDMGDAWKTTGSEIAVGSILHGFAGRYDLRGEVTKDVTLITRALTKAGEPLKRGNDRKSVVVPEGAKGLIDLKTSKSIYPTHLMQLEGYEGAGVECGLGETDFRAVLHVTKHGLYQFKRARATYANFLAILETYRTLESVKEALK